MTNKQKHLEFIQGVIDRMAGNLFFLKGWAVTLIAGLLALSVKDSNPKGALIAFFPVIIFWVLDGFFLSQERLFRDLYGDVAKFKEKDISFSMSTAEYKEKWRNTWIASMFSPTLLIFYLSLLLSVVFTKYLVIGKDVNSSSSKQHIFERPFRHRSLPKRGVIDKQNQIIHKEIWENRGEIRYGN